MSASEGRTTIVARPADPAAATPRRSAARVDLTADDGWPPGATTERPSDTDPLRRVDLVELARRGVRPPTFAVGGFLYGGYVHSLSGPPDCGKTTLALWWALAVLRAGAPVFALDDESGPEVTVERMLALGAQPDELAGLAYYPFPGRAWRDADVIALRAEIEAVRPALLVADSMSAMLAAGGRDEDRAGDVRRFIQAVLLEPARHYRHAALCTDHMRKDGVGGRYARGSGDKLAAVDVAYVMAPVKPFHRAASGLARLTVTKDRRGYLHRDHELRMTADAAGLRPEIVEVEPGPAGMPPARAKLLGVLRAADGRPLTVREIVDRVAAEHGHGLGRQTVSTELNALAAAGLADRLDHGTGRAAEWIYTDPEVSP